MMDRRVRKGEYSFKDKYNPNNGRQYNHLSKNNSAKQSYRPFLRNRSHNMCRAATYIGSSKHKNEKKLNQKNHILRSQSQIIMDKIPSSYLRNNNPNKSSNIAKKVINISLPPSQSYLQINNPSQKNKISFFGGKSDKAFLKSKKSKNNSIRALGDLITKHKSQLKTSNTKNVFLVSPYFKGQITQASRHNSHKIKVQEEMGLQLPGMIKINKRKIKREGIWTSFQGGGTISKDKRVNMKRIGAASDYLLNFKQENFMDQFKKEKRKTQGMRSSLILEKSLKRRQNQFFFTGNTIHNFNKKRKEKNRLGGRVYGGDCNI